MLQFWLLVIFATATYFTRLDGLSHSFFPLETYAYAIICGNFFLMLVFWFASFQVFKGKTGNGKPVRR